VKLAQMLLGALVIVGSAGAGRAGGLSADSGKVFVGEGGIEVALVELQPKGSKKFLIRVTGSGTELDGKVLPYDLEASDRDNRYGTVAHGKNAYYIQEDRRHGSRWIAYLPGHGDHELTLSWDEKKSKDLKLKDVVKQHEKQLSDKTIEKFARFDRPGVQAEQDKALAESAAKVGKACGTQVKAAVDWSTIDEAMLKEYSISSWCEGPLEAMEQLCSAGPEARKMLAFVKTVKCRFAQGQELAIRSRLNHLYDLEGRGQRQRTSRARSFAPK